MTPTSLVAYLVLFAGGAFAFLFFALLLGWFLRAKVPTPEKLRPYECGEPAVGTTQVRFDLRFYVVALVFLIFDVEVAFFFPWAVVFGKANQTAELAVVAAKPGAGHAAAVAAMNEKYVALQGEPRSSAAKSSAGDPAVVGATARRVVQFVLIDLAVFFAVLLVGFAYVWNQGDLDWVRAMGRSAGESAAEQSTEVALR
jgi:NADH-quinone oxidoreductase subunit A